MQVYEWHTCERMTICEHRESHCTAKVAKALKKISKNGFRNASKSFTNVNKNVSLFKEITLKKILCKQI